MERVKIPGNDGEPAFYDQIPIIYLIKLLRGGASNLKMESLRNQVHQLMNSDEKISLPYESNATQYLLSLLDYSVHIKNTRLPLNEASLRFATIVSDPTIRALLIYTEFDHISP